MRSFFRDRSDDDALRQLARLKPRPTVDEIAEAVAAHFGHDRSLWQPGRRVDDASRAVAVYVARRPFGYSAKAVAASLGYRGHGGVHNNAVARIENWPAALKATVDQLTEALHKGQRAL